MMKLTLGELLASGQWTSFPGFGSDSREFTFIFTSAQARAAFQKKFAKAEVESPDGRVNPLDEGLCSTDGTNFVLTFTWNHSSEVRAKILELFKLRNRPGVGYSAGWFSTHMRPGHFDRGEIEVELEAMRKDGTCNFRRQWYYLAETDDHREDSYHGEPT